MLRVQAIDHLVLVVADVERSVAWYRDVLGLEALRLEEWRAKQVFFPSLRIDEGTIIDVVAGERPAGTGNVDHFCLVIDQTDLATLRDSGHFDVVEGPVTRWGARGDGLSLYVRDPDGNVVELRHYGESEER
ncbi:MAG: VOC family protein [Actinomycetota bacterium]|nr:VOC family protein [Actinomycetota bacterium]